MVGLEFIALFRELRPEESQALRLITQERQFAAGAEIFHEGAPGDGVYFVKDGLVEISGMIRSNVRRVFFDDASNSFWIGANHKPTILKVEPLD